MLALGSAIAGPTLPGRTLLPVTARIATIVSMPDDTKPFSDWKFCYERIRHWLIENKSRCKVTQQGVVVLLQNGRETRPLENGTMWLAKIDSLPPVAEATPKQAAELFCWVMRGYFEWSKRQTDGQFCMRDYALAGQKQEEIGTHAKEVDEELTRLQQS